MKDDANHEQKLYDAAVQYMVAEKSEGDAWATVVSVAQDILTPIDVKAALDAAEKRIKKDFGISKMPSRWRSAKSTVLGALTAGVPLIEAGEPVPKTKVGKAIKAAATTAFPVVVSTEEKINDLLNGVEKLMLSLGAVESARVASRMLAMAIPKMPMRASGIGGGGGGPYIKPDSIVKFTEDTSVP